jgi:hypothetical protein
MRLDDLLDRFQTLRFPAKDEATHPDRALIVAARSAVEPAVVDDEFLADCIDLELKLIESGRPRSGLVPFFTMPDLGIRLAFGYWAPGQMAGAHEHTAWTITAVCRNELEVLTYHREATYRSGELVPKNRFHAPAGRVGTICEPCIHEPRNISTDWSLSFHVTSPRDGEPAGDGWEPPPALRSKRQASAAARGHPYARVVEARRRNRCVHQLARAVAAMNVARVPELLDRCSAVGSLATRDFADRALRRQRSPSDFTAGPRLVRTHERLDLRCRQDGDMVALDAETPNGPVEQFAVDEGARAAMAFIAREHSFEASAIPGNLTDEERAAIAEALEETGLFTRVDR